MTNLLIINLVLSSLILILILFSIFKGNKRRENYGCEFWESCFWEKAGELVVGIGKNILDIGKIVPKLLEGNFDSLGDALNNIKDIQRVIREVKDPKTKEERILRERAMAFLNQAIERVNQANIKLEKVRNKILDLIEEYNPSLQVALQNKLFINLAISYYLTDRKMRVFSQNLPQLIRFLSREGNTLNLDTTNLGDYISIINYFDDESNWSRIIREFQKRMESPILTFRNHKNWFWGDRNNVVNVSEVDSDGNFNIVIENIDRNFETEAPGIITNDGEIKIKTPLGIFTSKGTDKNNVVMFKSPQGLDVMVFPKI